MVVMKIFSWVFFLLFLLLQTNFPISVNCQSYDYPTANLSTTWKNSVSANHSVSFSDTSTVRAILLRGPSAPYFYGPSFACGFFCNGTCDTYLFAVFIVYANSGSRITGPTFGFPRVVWSANRNNPVKINSSVELTSEGDLVLRDSDGAVAWSTNTANKSVAGLNLTESGNLLLFDANNATVWQSFDYPTDTLVPEQKLFAGQKLTSSTSETNWTQGMLAFSVSSAGLLAFIESNTPQSYYETKFTGSNQTSYVKFINGSLSSYTNDAPNNGTEVLSVALASSKQFMKFGDDGHLRVFEWDMNKNVWNEVADLLTGYYGNCKYPLVCGDYGICSSDGQCSCPVSNNGTNFFKVINDRQPNLGCSTTSQLNCEASEYHEFLELKDTTYFDLALMDLEYPSMENCKEVCLKNCSCMAAIFTYGSNASGAGQCYLPSQVFSLTNNNPAVTHYNSTAFLKVQVTPTASSSQQTNKSSLGVIVGSTVGSVFVLCVIVFLIVFFRKRNNAEDDDQDEEDYLNHLTGMPTRFSYEELKSATMDFSKKLGEGGFGSVFEGTLPSGEKIAVKCLDGLGQIRKSFLAEVETIGSIHHVNLVRLIGFCADKSHRLLVYEFMSNGSLDRWVFNKYEGLKLGWNQRKKIIIDIAKGLTYLHEDCRQKIIHLDIKPPNILLDDHFNAKVADFGLSKLIDRDQSQVMTTMRGTPGYLAPEWLSSGITEKVDVYSYGVVVLELLCGRKNIDQSQDEDEMHLLKMFNRKSEEEQLIDLVDKNSDDMQLHKEEVLKMMKVAAWCLQNDFNRRPSMSVVVKVLEGVMDVEESLDYGFSNYNIYGRNEFNGKLNYRDSTPLLPSILSGPR